MFETDACPAAPAPAVRVPFAALASRPYGIAVAAGVVDLADAIGRAQADEPTREHDPESEAEAELVTRSPAGSGQSPLQMLARSGPSQRWLGGRCAGCAEHGAEDSDHGIRTAASIVSAESHFSRPCSEPGGVGLRTRRASPRYLGCADRGAHRHVPAGIVEETRPPPPTRGCAPRSRATCWSKRVAKRGCSYGPLPVAQSWLLTLRPPKSGTPGTAPDGESSHPFRNRTGWPPA